MQTDIFYNIIVFDQTKRRILCIKKSQEIIYYYFFTNALQKSSIFDLSNNLIKEKYTSCKLNFDNFTVSTNLTTSNLNLFYIR